MKKTVLVILCSIFLFGNAMAESVVRYHNKNGSETTVVYGPLDASGNREVDVYHKPSYGEVVEKVAPVLGPSENDSDETKMVKGAITLITAGLFTAPVTTLVVTTALVGGWGLWKIFSEE